MQTKEFYQFLEQQLKGRYKGELNPGMKLYKDLGLYGDEADEFLTQFVKNLRF